MRQWLKCGLFVIFVATLSGAALADDPMVDPNLPPDVQAVMHKMETGAQLSPNDQRVLDAWEQAATTGAPYHSPLSQTGAAPGGTASAGAGGGGGGAGGGGGGAASAPELTVDTAEEDRNPCRSGGHAIGFGAVPSKSDYVAMARAVMQTYGMKLSHKERSGLAKTLAATRVATAGSDNAPILEMTGDTKAAIVSAAYSAERATGDALTANNLGAALSGAGDFKDAAIAMQYARSLAPKSPMVATNLGWLAMSQGDTAAAGSLFQTAVQQAPQMASALAGRGLLQECAHHSVAALPLFRASLMQAFTDIAASGIENAEDEIRNATKDDDKLDLGPHDAYGPKSGDGPDVPNPPVPPTAKDVAAFMEVHGPTVFDNYTTVVSQAIITGTTSAGASEMHDAGPRTTYDGHRLVFRRGYDKERFVLDDIRSILNAELNKPISQMVADVDAFRKEDGCLSCAGIASGPVQLLCAPKRARATAAYALYRPKFMQDWNDLRNAIADIYGFSAPWLAQIRDPITASGEKSLVDQAALSAIGAYGGALKIAGIEIAVAWPGSRPDGSDCDSPEAAAPKPQKVKPYKVDATKCRTPPSSMPFAFAQMDADCDKVQVSFGTADVGLDVGYHFAPDYKFEDGVYKWNGDAPGEWSLFAGFQASTPTNPVVAAGAKAGEYITWQGTHVTDVGVQVGASAGINVGAEPGEGGGYRGGLSRQVGETARIGLIKGVSVNSDASTSSSWSDLPN